MKKKTIIIGAVVVVLAMAIAALCTNLFGFRTRAAKGINRIRWNIDCESISVETALHAQTLSSYRDQVCPGENYVLVRNCCPKLRKSR